MLKGVAAGTLRCLEHFGSLETSYFATPSTAQKSPYVRVDPCVTGSQGCVMVGLGLWFPQRPHLLLSTFKVRSRLTSISLSNGRLNDTNPILFVMNSEHIALGDFDAKPDALVMRTGRFARLDFAFA